MKFNHMKVLLILDLFFACLTIGSAQDIGHNSTMKEYVLFKSIRVGIPEEIKRIEMNMDLVEEMGFAHFSTADKKTEITIRQMEEMDLAQVKGMMDGLSTSMYNGKILKSEVVRINNIEFFVTDIKGQWNGKGEVIGMFRYYFNSSGNSYNLLMKYPVDLIDKTKKMKEKMLESIKIVQ